MDSTPAGATRMGNRSSTRHGGPAQVFMGPVRKWRKVLSPVSGSSPSPSAARTALLKWTPVPPATTMNGGVKEDSPMTDEMIARQVRPVKYIPISAVLLRSREEAAVEEAENAEAEASGTVELLEAADTTGATEKNDAAEPMDIAGAGGASEVAEAVDKSDAAGGTGATAGTGAARESEAVWAKETTGATGANEASNPSESLVKEGGAPKQLDPPSGDTRLTSIS